MNLAFNLNQFRGDRIFFMETKPNSLIDGLFTKINYCDEQFTMNGICLTFPGGEPCLDRIRIDSVHYRSICDIEQELLRTYVNARINKTRQSKLGEALHAKYEIVGARAMKLNPVIVKISGIWENKLGHVGLSYRIM